MTERQAASRTALYLGDDGRLYEVQGVGHLEDEQGRIEIMTTDGPFALVRAEIRGQR